jgi:hypothetical protein
MSIAEFSEQLGRPFVVEPIGKAWRCYFQGAMYTDKPGLNAVAISIIGAGPNQQRMREDFVGKIRGKVARTYDGTGHYREFPVPLALRP